ncbi:MAG: GFA family protein [Betaproteobacteria bacterium]
MSEQQAMPPAPAGNADAQSCAPAIGEARARCMCGRVRMVARSPSRFCAHCHCESCRRAHAAGFVTWIGYRSEQVSVSEGAELMQSYESSPGTSRTFCRHCGTRLTFSSTRWPGETHIPLACFDTPVDRAPTELSYVEEHASWISLPASTHA